MRRRVPGCGVPRPPTSNSYPPTGMLPSSCDARSLRAGRCSLLLASHDCPCTRRTTCLVCTVQQTRTPTLCSSDLQGKHCAVVAPAVGRVRCPSNPAFPPCRAECRRHGPPTGLRPRHHPLQPLRDITAAGGHDEWAGRVGGKGRSAKRVDMAEGQAPPRVCGALYGQNGVPLVVCRLTKARWGRHVLLSRRMPA